MAIRIRVTVDVDYLGALGGGDQVGFVGQGQSNNPGYAAAFNPGAVGVAQTMELMVAEIVPGGDSPTLANFLTALTNAANDMAGTPTSGSTPIFSQVGAWGGNPGLTPLQVATGWATSNP